MNKKIKVLVTGAAGFIGSNLCEYLCEQGYLVTGLDNFTTGHKHNLKALENENNFSFIEGDIRDLETCQRAATGQEFILHQAALGSVPRSIKDPITSTEVNINGFLNMLVACRDQSVKKMVYAASSSTYGDSKALPKEEDKIGKPLSPYAATKYVNEIYADVFYRTYGVNTIGLRYFNVFGRKQDPNGAYAAVIPKFTKQLMCKEPLTINGDGTFSRDFTYIDNVIQANEKAMLATSKDTENQVFNVAYGGRTTLNCLVKELKRNLANYDEAIVDVEVINGPERAGDVPHSQASIDKAKKLLGYNPQFDIASGLKEATSWYWENL